MLGKRELSFLGNGIINQNMYIIMFMYLHILALQISILRKIKHVKLNYRSFNKTC